MKSSKCILVALLLLGAVPVRGAGDLIVLYPPDLTLVEEGSVKMFAYQGGGGIPTHVRVNGKVAARLDGEVFRKAEIALVPGLNVLEAGGKTVRVYSLPNSKLDIFRAPAEKEGVEPLAFRKLRLHPALDDGCEGCHTIEGARLAAKPQKEACYACHTDFGAPEEGKEKFLHAPVAAGECTGCHDPHFSARPKLQKLEKGCLECHDAPPESGTIHYPVKNRECTACHGPHVGPAPKQLVRPGNALCIGCHEKPHAQHRSADVKGKLTQIPDDFPRDKGELGCLGCHKAHQSEERRLFVLPQGKLCQTCHPV